MWKPRWKKNESHSFDSLEETSPALEELDAIGNKILYGHEYKRLRKIKINRKKIAIEKESEGSRRHFTENDKI